MLKALSAKRAYSLAERHQPIAFAEFRHFWDYSCEIFEGFPAALTRPPAAYYWCRTDGEKWYYIGYALYHAQDWAAWPADLLPGECHQYDFEAVLCRIPYYLPHHEPKRGVDYITVHHHELLTFSAPAALRPAIFIEAGGHGIEGLPRLDGKNVLTIEDWRLIPLDPIMENPKRREGIRQIFNNCGVHLPDQWSNHGQYPGWFWHRPDDLFAALFK